MTDPNGKSSNKSQVAQREEKILNFWRENNIFQKSLGKDSPKGEFVFYDGPPFATGTPHYGHLLPGTVKDIIPRFKTMQGYHVPRKWGWDTHGLPIENLIEKELGLKTKKDIEEYGIDKFNKAAKDSVFKYEAIWKDVIPRTGRWVDMENPYITMDSNYTESVWWMFKELFGKKLIKEGFKSMHLCPRCETTLSNFEVNQGYKDVKDISVTAKFELINEPGTYVLAWTTTPWTLPGNVALAVSKDIEYQVVEQDGKTFIVAKELVKSVFKDSEYSELKTIKGEELIGKSYKPLFNYYSSQKDLENKENGWKIYSADFVTTEDGTGIVHIAPAFGDDDYQLSVTENLPFVQHVNKDGSFREEVTDFKGIKVKEKDKHQDTDILIIKYLAEKELLFSKLKLEHSYPHCWRCDTPLLNYATSSWFIDVPKIKSDLLKENQKINWVPETIGKNRFANWLEDAKEWAISRSRFWGAPIPVWRSEDGDIEVLGSVSDIKEKTKGTNKYFVMRHGEAESNAGNFVSGDNTVKSNLTEKGKEDVSKVGDSLKKEKIDLIITSPLDRTSQTAKIIAEKLGLSEDKIIVDKRIREIESGEFNGKPIEMYRAHFKSLEEKFEKRPEGGENITDVRKRCGEFIYDIDKKYEGKNILVVTHEYCVWMLEAVKEGLNQKDTVEIKISKDDFVEPGHYAKFDFAPLPHNEEYELDFHRPYIDKITFKKDNKEYKRVEEVFDVWIDSGSVPFASEHYPFQKNVNPKGGLMKSRTGYPADFIAESLDQTRGWFYTLLVLNTALFGKSPYKNVMVSGLILAEDGKKMSKKLKNYPEVDVVLDKYGADAMRFYLMNSPAVKADDLNFSEKGVDEVVKKIVMRLDNVTSFYEMYTDDSIALNGDSKHILDKWIISRLSETHKKVTDNLNGYEIDRATRPILEFIDDLSTWYIRRSRDRFKSEDFEDKKRALETTKFVLIELSKIMAPITPFIAEDVYQRVGGVNESVHLESWTDSIELNENVLEEMKQAREIVTFALDARTAAKIKVRQPLQFLTVYSKIDEELYEILKDEVNVKEIIYSSEKEKGNNVKLDTNISPELQKEGDARELIRAIQSARKNLKLKPEDKVYLNTTENTKEIIDSFNEEIKKTTNIISVEYNDKGEDVVKLSFGEAKISVVE